MTMDQILYNEPGKLFWRTKRIMLPVDGSKGTARAATVAFELAETTKAKLYIIHVINTGTVRQISRMTEADEIDILNKYIGTGSRLLEGYKRAASEYGIEAELLLEQGHPSERIVQKAKELKIDLIVIGSRGESSATRFGVGSSTDRVVHNSHCLVLVVK
jgi:nucleotide-binding universal stress UspA family protein